MAQQIKKLRLKKELDEVQSDWRNDLVKLLDYQTASNDLEARMALQKLIEIIREWRKAK